MRSFALICLFALSSSGCAAFNSLNSDFPWSKEKKREQQEKIQPVRVVTFWSEMMLNTGVEKPVRGFGGRVYLYNKFGKPVRADGTFTVYAYDDTDKTAETASRGEPDMIFTYRKEEFANYFSKSDLGDSYSIWLPWDGVDGEQKEISLLPKFVTSSGEVIRGTQDLVTLSGKKKKAKTEPLSDSQRFLKKQLENQYGEEADEIAALLYSGKTPGEWVDPAVKAEIKSRRQISKEIPLTESMIKTLNNASPQAKEDQGNFPAPSDSAATPIRQSNNGAAQAIYEEEYVQAPNSSYTQEKKLTANEFIDQTENAAPARRFGLQRNRLLASSSLSAPTAPSPAVSPRSQSASRRVPRSGPEPVVTERGQAVTEFEKTPDWISH
jgi:hypothetical protein